MTAFITHGLIGLALWGGLILALNHANEPVRYDCSLSSFHPDYPGKVRKTCREAQQLTKPESRKTQP